MFYGKFKKNKLLSGKAYRLNQNQCQCQRPSSTTRAKAKTKSGSSMDGSELNIHGSRGIFFRKSTKNLGFVEEAVSI
jgi:hypothetical protein